ncbi:MAG: adenosine deaminase [Anaerolineae bacterium]|nr:adenosine deaminase [Anaerolineae bacterium]
MIRTLPKIELHRHLEGSVRLETLVSIASDHGIEMPEYTVEDLRPFVQMMPNETRNSQHFLAKFQTLRQFFRSPEVIRRVAYEAVADAAADNIRYLELRFTPPALSSVMNCSYHEVVDWVCMATAEAAAHYNIEVRLILSMNRHESTEIGEKVLHTALDFRDRGVVALDLAGNEGGFSAEPFGKVFKQVKKAGFGITIHAGEWAGSDNIRHAIKQLHADRIGHGVRALEDKSLCQLLVERGVVLEVCPTSNVHSGVVDNWSLHPLARLYHQHILTTINTDDPLVSNITLSDEIEQVMAHLSFTLDDVKHQILTAARAAFLPDSERAALVAKFETWLAAVQ